MVRNLLAPLPSPVTPMLLSAFLCVVGAGCTGSKGVDSVGADADADADADNDTYGSATDSIVSCRHAPARPFTVHAHGFGCLRRAADLRPALMPGPRRGAELPRVLA